jgi:GT2 family glycosyltransferase
MLSIVIPVRNVEDATNECIDDLLYFSSFKDTVEIIVVDNGSDVPYTHDEVITIRNEKNVGFWPAMLQGIEHASSEYVLCMHNDVFVWEHEYDSRIVTAFENDPLLGAVGFFGGRGVGLNGGRGHPEGNMLGRKYGTSQEYHGHILTGSHPAVVFDSLAIAIRKSHLEHVSRETLPPHHWTDRLLCLRMIKAGFRCLTLGIAFDHGGSFTAIGTNSLNTFTEEWCKDRNLEMVGSWDNTLYLYGQRMFEDEMKAFIPANHTQLWVTADWNYHAR